ncbi:hypothetical protein FRB95_013498 [Tulasnella sp. JGI-2019a]|nr:hypothetical protein FRB95_013498 [Tulasnella sp. JGI-2019a]
MASELPTYDAVNSAPTSAAADVLPGYDASSALHPATARLNHNLPPIFRIGQSYTKSLVQPSDLHAHLILLGAFHRLREQVQTDKGQTDFRLEPDELWAVFLERAVHRFFLWVTRIIGDHSTEDSPTQVPRHMAEDRCPPLDVMMVWHTYMLSPRLYQEDCIRIHRGLQAIGSFPLLQICSTIDGESLLPHAPSASRSTAFRSFTGESFDPPIRTRLEDTVTIYCPSCSRSLTVPWLSQTGYGYAQRGFSATCDIEGGCGMQFDRETLGVRRFYEDMSRCMANPDSNFLANTLVDQRTGVPHPDLAKTLTGIILKSKLDNPLKSGGTDVRPEALGQELGWKIKDVERFCREGFLSKHNRPVVDTPRPINLVLAPYRHVGPFSMDLASAVLRQMSFIEKMVNLGWTEDGRFEEDLDTLTRCVVRYHAFLDLMASVAGRFVVPTLDIDLAWHTHQLLCVSYRNLFNIMGIVPDHDDKVTQSALSTAYDETAAAWKARFSVPYSVCGCPPPIKSKSTSPITSILNFSRKGKGKAAPNELSSINNPRPDLVAASDVSAEDTHPSDHNSVALMNSKGDNEAQARRQELSRRCRELGLAADRGPNNKNALGDWTGLISKRTLEHSPAFLAPVTYDPKAPFGKYGQGDCAVYSGRGVKGEFSTGECAVGNGHNGMCGALFDHQRNGLAESILQGITMTGDKALMAEYGIKYANMAHVACGSGGHCGGGITGSPGGFGG